MGGSSSQVVGYRYFANFLLFIGNPIEALHAINFDKRMWITGRIVPTGDGQLRYVHSPNLYGENEGGISGVICVKYGKNGQYEDSAYAKYMADIGMPVSAYPYQSYISFSGNVLASQFQGMTDEELQDLADEYEDGIVPGKGFYLGNSGYMKEMLLWVKRIHVRNDGRPQWYDEKAEIPEYFTSNFNQKNQLTSYEGVFVVTTRYGDQQEVQNSDIFKTSVFEPFLFTRGYTGLSDENLNAPDSLSIKYIISNYNFGGFVKVIFNVGHRSESLSRTIYGSVFEEGENYIIYNANGSDFGFEFVAQGALADPIAFKKIALFITDMYAVSPVDRLPNLEYGDMNPIHKIREILTDDTAMSKPESDVNNVNFMKAADRIWDEGLGISWSITEKSCLEAIEELCGHIEAGVRVNRQTGLYEMVLFRDDWFEESEIYTLPVNKIKSMALEVANADEAINQLNVTYYNRTVIKDSSFSIAENASIRNLNGRVNAEDADFPYFMNQRNAAIVAQWKLKQMSSPVWKGSFTTAEYNARKWNRYDLLKLAWPRKWQGEITVRIMKINLGTGAEVSIDFVEVVPYSSQLWSDVVIDEPIDVGVQPPLACPYEPFEMPYYLAVMALGQRQVDEELNYENNFGLVGVVAQQPQSNSLYAVMMTHNGVEGEEWLRAATINYEPVAELDQIISRTSTNFTVKDSAAISGLPIGTLIKCGSDWIGTPGEWMVFIGIDPYTGVVSVKRGALDSLPQEWGAGTKLYFCGNDVAYDSTEYVAGEEVLVSALTTTPSGMLENKGSIGIEMNARAFRPYPPANVKINGEYWPEEIETDLILTWVDRNRVQQTGGEILGWFDGGVTIEPDTTTHLNIIERDKNGVVLATHNANVTGTMTHTIAISTMQAEARTIEIHLKTVKDGYDSYQAFNHIVEIAKPFSAPYNLNVEYME